MNERIGEKINMVALFQGGRIFPRYFTWHRRVYKVTDITSTWHAAEGQFRLYYFTVCTEQPNIYEIMLSTKNMLWELVSIYHGG
ncbi:MAG: hypothetical protein ACM3WV_01965 [Bacillota bacterium]